MKRIFRAWALLVGISLGVAHCSVDETSYLDPDRVYVSPASEKSASTLYVVGAPSALTQVGRPLRLDNVTTGESNLGLVAESGSFVVDIRATVGDSLRLVYNEEALSLVASTEPLSQAMPFPNGYGTGDPEPWLVRQDAARIAVEWDVFVNPVVPNLVFNLNSGASVEVVDFGVPTVIDAVVGEMVCIVALGATQTTSLPLCTPAP